MCRSADVNYEAHLTPVCFSVNHISPSPHPTIAMLYILGHIEPGYEIHRVWKWWQAPTEMSVLVQNNSSDVQTNTFTRCII